MSGGSSSGVSTTERTHVRPSTAGSNTVVAEVDAAQRVSRVDRDVLTRFATGCLALGLRANGAQFALHLAEDRMAEIRNRRIDVSIDLVRALGGGYRTDAPVSLSGTSDTSPSSTALASAPAATKEN